MTTVYWTPVLNQDDAEMAINEAALLFEEPKPLMKELMGKYKNYDFMKCPSVQAYCKNVFVVSAPMDAEAFVTKQDDGSPSLFVRGDGWDQAFYQAFCSLRKDGAVSMPPTYLFYAKESLEMECQPLFLLDSSSIENVLNIPGGFNIGKWVRSVDFTFVIKDISKPVKICRGDPLFLIRFKTDKRVEFERVEFNKELRDIMGACVRLKRRVSNLALPVLYAMAKTRLTLFFKKEAK